MPTVDRRPGSVTGPGSVNGWARVLALLGLLITGTVGLVSGIVEGLVGSTFGTLAQVLIVIGGLILVGAAALARLGVARRIRAEPHEVGIVLDLDPGDRPSWSGQHARAALSQAIERQRSTAVVEMRLSTNPAIRSAELDSVHDQIGKALADRHLTTPDSVSLYPSATTVHDSFVLGRRLRAGSFSMILMQKSGSDDSLDPFHTAVRLGDTLRKPLSLGERERAETFLRSRPVELATDADERRVALLVALSANPVQIIPTMREAAATGRSDSYQVGPTDRCQAGFKVEAIKGFIRADRDAFELTVRYIHNVWNAWLDSRGGASDQVLFLAGPNTIAMALGHVFGRQTLRIVPHNPPPR